ncbi:MAG: hypothetical protein ACH346_01995 [Chthoniobacterales bacterium]
MTSHRIFGVGNAGVNFLDSLLMSAPAFSGLIAINNDADALAASVVTTKISLPADQDLATAFEECRRDISGELDAASLVILCGGLGGTTASTLLPRLAGMGKAAKKTTIACVSQPFLFEGKRAQTLALESLAVLEQVCDGLLLLDNNALCTNKSKMSALEESFVASDEAMQLCIPALLAMLASKGPVRINRSDLLSAMSRSGAKTIFGSGQATGANRLHEAVERAFKSPLLRERALAKANKIFLLLRGPKDLSFAEAQAAMQEVERIAGSEHDIQLSVQASEADGSPVQIFILASLGGTEKNSVEVIEVQKTSSHKIASGSLLPITIQQEPSKSFKEQPESLLDGSVITLDSEPRPIAKNTPNATNLKIAAWEIPINKSTMKQKPKQTQGALNLTAAQRGRFDKSEPTIVEGEDLDTPTYLRLGLKLAG